MPYLNVEARWDGAPDQGMFTAKGGRGFPFCAILSTDGSVLWELRPSSETAWKEGLELARRLARLQRPTSTRDAAAAATLALLDAMSRLQRPKPSLTELDRHAATPGIERDLLEHYRRWRVREELTASVDARSRDGGASALGLFLAGKRPAEADAGLGFSFYLAALEGAIAAKDAANARSLLELWKQAAANPNWQAWVEAQAAKYTLRIDAIDGAP